MGSAVVAHYAAKGWRIIGVDNNSRQVYFGPDGDVSGQMSVNRTYEHYHHVGADIRNSWVMDNLFKKEKPDAVVHCAAQPAHEWSKLHPVEDFDINTGATVQLLDHTRTHVPDSPFVFLSSSKVYGSSINKIQLVEAAMRYDYYYIDGIDESYPLDGSWHSPYGAHKAAADIIVQEYGHEYGMKTVCFRPNCMTGSAHAGATMHGFLSWLVKCAAESRTYTINGYKGKQVRDNIHAVDVATAIGMWIDDPGVAEVFNIGGGRSAHTSICEMVHKLKSWGYPLNVQHNSEPRGADHIVYVTDTGKLEERLPEWKITYTIDDMAEEILSISAAARTQKMEV